MKIELNPKIITRKLLYEIIERLFIKHNHN